MPIILSQTADGKVVIRATSNESYVVVGNNSVSNLLSNNDFSNSTYTPVVSSAHITKLIWSAQSANAAHITIARANSSANVILWDLYNTGELDLKALGLAANSENATGNLVITFTAGTSNGFVLVELKKQVNVYYITSPNE